MLPIEDPLIEVRHNLQQLIELLPITSHLDASPLTIGHHVQEVVLKRAYR